MRGKTALVTGSTSGIGLAIARQLAAEGCNTVVTGLGNPSEIERLAKELTHEHGVPVGIDILVNNAGTQHVAEIDVFPEEKWDQIIAVNLSAAFHATKAVLPGMKQAGWGRVINISSVHGLVASAGKAAYVAAKHGLIGLTKVTALENARFGITANAICPGWVSTPMVERQVLDRAHQSGLPIQQEQMKLLAAKQPLSVFTTPKQIAELCVFLCTESASTITGASLAIDGGWSAQ